MISSNKIVNLVFLLGLFMSSLTAMSQKQVPSEKILTNDELFLSLNTKENPELRKIADLYSKGSKKGKEEAKLMLAAYFKQKASERYYFDWQSFDQRFQEYMDLFPDKKKGHPSKAKEHMELYPGTTTWKRPFTNLKGEAVDAYAVRHLARQHKAPDIALSFYITKDVRYINYFTDQVASLNAAFAKNKVETVEDGNGAFEVFIGGYRVLNWLYAHHAFLASDEYSPDEQLLLLRTFLHHAAFIYQQNQKFKFGNHQTKGLTALALIAMLYPEFEGADQWYSHAIDLLGQHLEKEINPDGFQFERTVHYHIGDIDNYFYVYQLARLNNMPVPEKWTGKLRSMFQALTAIALPNKNGPVLQDDTGNAWAEQNEIHEVMLLGYLLFKDPSFAYFASDNIGSDYYWLIRQQQLEELQKKQVKKPSFTSTALPETGYYVMRDGWSPKDKYMIISTGVSKEKPDHQHGDILGVQAYANGRAVIPNYQVRYPLPDYQHFKNSWVKNVALADSVLQGREWEGNTGGSGFGKFKILPNASVTNWFVSPQYDLFSSTHDGFQQQDVAYARKVLFLKGSFWIIKDSFKSSKPHTYQQVWQGNYSLEDGPTLARANYEDASGLDIFQFAPAQAISMAGSNGKNRIVYQTAPASEHSYITLLRPYKGNANRIEQKQNSETVVIDNWQVVKGNFTGPGLTIEAEYGLANGSQYILFNCSKIQLKKKILLLQKQEDLMLSLEDGKLKITSLADADITVAEDAKSSKSYLIKPNETLVLN